MHSISSTSEAFLARIILLVLVLSASACSTSPIKYLYSTEAVDIAPIPVLVNTSDTPLPDGFRHRLPRRVILSPEVERECILLIHGLARRAKALKKMRNTFAHNGYLAIALDYPSTEYSIEQLSQPVLTTGIDACQNNGATRIHLVTHSMGGIIARHYLKYNDIPNFGRLIMLAPPNQGSELVDFYSTLPGFKKLLGPAVVQLGTDKERSLPLKLGPVMVDTAVVAGSVSSNSIMSITLPGPDDGKVTFASTKVQGMCAQLLLPTSHRLIIQDDQTIEEIINYIHTGKFISNSAEYSDCSKPNELNLM